MLCPCVLYAHLMSMHFICVLYALNNEHALETGVVLCFFFERELLCVESLLHTGILVYKNKWAMCHIGCELVTCDMEFE